MRKDYTAIQASEQTLDDLAYVDQYWTERWVTLGLEQVGNRATHLSKRQEYQIMRPYLQRLPNDAKVLDAGCGHGEWTVLLAQQGYKVTGLDISEPVITALQKQFPDLAFTHGDIRHMDFKANSFDALFSWGAFEHFELGLQPCISESWRVLKPGGYLFITVPYQNLRHLIRELRQWDTWDRELAHAVGNGHTNTSPQVRFYQWRLTRPELARELAIGGFKVLEVIPVQFVEGVKRTVEIDLKLKADTVGHRLGMRLCKKVLPIGWVAHMIMAVAQKPSS